ncbi:DUF6516 family protein [Rhizobium sp. AG855]|uniref:toxin-antitoxin system TumE family protein n=1 Tax=Rhizobium sp. AG855 TaxID=2183898 RepID=UPI000E75D2B8|nr:DUF6516 family protein [Rhizobium sp. AG855]RKE85904.1 hypothetical protein DFO46_2707 [Rhizobium sp. AG855]
MAKATLIRRLRSFVRSDVFVEIVIWQVPASVRGSQHAFKYSLALIANGECVLRYDNEAGKGDHRHLGSTEAAYAFTGIDALTEDFLSDVKGWLDDNPEGEDREPRPDNGDRR